MEPRSQGPIDFHCNMVEGALKLEPEDPDKYDLHRHLYSESVSPFTRLSIPECNYGGSKEITALKVPVKMGDHAVPTCAFASPPLL